MKKSLVGALTTALVVGAASTTFAAVNPFTDVPADHWAYDAVTQLAADGVIEGYGDGTFLGENEITRYEMAQMIAKAMARTDVSATDRALIDKLAAEFADELNNLGVRVANLERNADMVKWTGEMRYTYNSTRTELASGKKDKDNKDVVQFRLFPTAEVNDHWHVKARLTAKIKDFSQDQDADTKLSYVYAQGDYDNLKVKLGKQEFYSTADDGLVMDDFFSGASVTFGKSLKATLEAGRFNLGDSNGFYDYDANGKHVANSALKEASIANDSDDTASYQGIELNGANGKLYGGAAYRHFNSDTFKYAAAYKDNGTSDDANIWSVGLGYAFDKNVSLFGSYANNTEADSFDTAHAIKLAYKGAKQANKGSWGAWVAYHYLGQNVAIMPTYDTAVANTKGYEVGMTYAPLTNTKAYLEYFDGKDLATDRDVNVLFGRLSFFF